MTICLNEQLAISLLQYQLQCWIQLQICMCAERSCNSYARQGQNGSNCMKPVDWPASLCIECCRSRSIALVSCCDNICKALYRLVYLQSFYKVNTSARDLTKSTWRDCSDPSLQAMAPFSLLQRGQQLARPGLQKVCVESMYVAGLCTSCAHRALGLWAITSFMFVLVGSTCAATVQPRNDHGTGMMCMLSCI